MAYATVALKPRTKERLEEIRRSAGFTSADEVVAAALDELEDRLATAAVRQMARRRRAPQPSLLDLADRDSQGLETTVARLRGRAGRRRG
ncbi:MAG TPA: hypothetical protein VGR28_12675 [Candidatus Thermoplasmatota archaeon]|jgi:Arc/MetJ-type ribon-helix-helix transcriptional regulator|nr:hypothetical protein [Candidatus Thermoplasmatota archaeon]